MKRPLKDKRPLGPIADLTPMSGEFTDFEVQMLMDGLTRMLREKVEALEEAEDEMRPDPKPQDIATELRFKRRGMDEAAQKVASLYKDRDSIRPDSFGDYQRLAKRRDDLLEDYN
jgi:hypothetical protein